MTTTDINQRPAEISEKPKKYSWRIFSRLQGKLIVPYVVLTLLLAAMGTFVITRLVANSVRERFVNVVRNASLVVQDEVKRRERIHLEELRVLANTEGVVPAVMASNAVELERLLMPLVLNNKSDLVTVMNISGLEIITWGYDPQTGLYVTSSGNDFSQIKAVQEALDGDSDTLGDKYIGLVNTAHGPAFVTTVALAGPDELPVGAMMIGTRLETLVNILRDVAGQEANIVLLDETPHLLAATLPEPEEIASALEALATQADPQNAQTVDIEIEATDVKLYERPFQVMYTPWELRSENVGWIGVVFESSYLVSSETTNRTLFSILFTIGTVAVILLGYFISQNIARPILRLRSMSQAVAAGDLNQQIGLNRSDEIGDLAKAFDVMTAHLRERTAEAERLYLETVERNQELAEINARLQATQLQLIQSEKLAAVGQLTAGIVHDVKNPLAVIKGLAELLEEDPLNPEETRKELRVIRESADRASRIVGDLLKFARQSSSELQEQDIRETVESSLRLTAYLLRQANIQLTKELPDSPVIVNYDAQQLEQVLINMIHNAIQAMPERGSLSVNLTTKNGTAAIAIKDSGTGITPENLKRIFDPFFTTKPEGQGTGLGLSVSYGIIANHNGQIDVQSELGKGTTFTIKLPTMPRTGLE